MEDRGESQNTGGIIEEARCPVCGKPLHKENLIDQKSVIEDNIYYVGGVRIINSCVQLHCDFQHQFNEDGSTMDEPHQLVGVIQAVFDDNGECITFCIKEILPKGGEL